MSDDLWLALPGDFALLKPSMPARLDSLQALAYSTNP